MNTQQFIEQNGIDALTTELNIACRFYSPPNAPDKQLVSLNYSQLLSPKWHPVVQECRGLVLEVGTWNIVHRPMTRFYNANEDPRVMPRFPGDVEKFVTKPTSSSISVIGEEGDLPDNNNNINPEDCNNNNNNNIITYKDVEFCCEKIDGSLIKIYNYNNTWYVATRATVIADGPCTPEFTFQQLVYKALNVEDDVAFQQRCNTYLNPDISYNCELTSLENRVVTFYRGYTLWFLSARYRTTGDYVLVYDIDDTNNDNTCTDKNTVNNELSFQKQIISFGMQFLPKLIFQTEKECVEYVNAMPDLKEGVVAYGKGNVPLFKYKSLAYLKVHHECSLDRPIELIYRDLVLTNEYAEYLSYFPERTAALYKWKDAKQDIFDWLEKQWAENQSVLLVDRRQAFEKIRQIIDYHETHADKDIDLSNSSSPWRIMCKLLEARVYAHLKMKEQEQQQQQQANSEIINPTSTAAVLTNKQKKEQQAFEAARTIVGYTFHQLFELQCPRTHQEKVIEYFASRRGVILHHRLATRQQQQQKLQVE